ncbi:TIGR04283 family arsenosugar biosynthesis glycosyltransferase [Algoriphagus litoralis]|uniref:TIGR04283 family arsenosugar biosynthesis glycosyltransferase n=1 Tax=Algoriphagus litoralis TaxID=2202829 RepID=UPI001E375737|nr:TIGR04283 family arsenosugar biosynthesis glycosyltransferase [Algoriphagus litoralis]
MMKMSVIIPTWNEAENIKELIPYLKKYGGEFISEIIVADGGSSDDTCQLAAGLGAIVLRSKVKSRAHQLNLGASQAKANTLYFVHADTRPVQSFAEDLQIAVVKGYKAGCFRYRFDSDTFLLKVNSWFTRFNGLFSGGGDQTLFISRDFFNTLGGYDTKYCLMEDFELVKRIKRRTKFYIVPKTMTVSARKYRDNSWLRVQVVNLYVFVMFHLGMAPEKLKKSYSTLLSNGSSS